MIRRWGRPGWYFRQMVDGKVRWKALGTDYDVAVAKVHELRGSIPLPDMTVKEASKMWLQSYVKVNRRKQDQPLAAQRVKDYLVPNLGHYLLQKLTREHLRGYRLKLEESHLSEQSVVHVLSDARCFLRWCEETGKVDRAPIPRKLVPRLQERPPDRLSDEEVERLVVLEEPYGFICRFLLSTGLRWGELVRAQTSDIQGNALVVHRTKSKKVRRVPLPEPIRSELKNRVGKLVNMKVADSFNQSVRRRSGIERFHVHQLRHTFACRWIEEGRNLGALQAILGHSTVLTTQRYARLSDEYVQMEAERLVNKL